MEGKGDSSPDILPSGCLSLRDRWQVRIAHPLESDERGRSICGEVGGAAKEWGTPRVGSSFPPQVAKGKAQPCSERVARE